MQERRFYIYEHRVKEEFEIDGKLYPVGTVVYVGSGTNNRYTTKADRIEKHKAVWDNLDKIIVLNNLTMGEKLQKEDEYIGKYWESGYLFNSYRNSNKNLYIDIATIMEYMYVDSTSPSGLRWKSKISRKIVENSVAGCKNNKGYWRVRFQNKFYLCHRLVWVLSNMVQIPEFYVINHIDLNPSNNSIENLESVSVSVNNKRKGVSKNNKTGYSGLCWVDDGNYWLTNIHTKDGVVRKSFGTSKIVKDGSNFEIAKQIAKDEALEYLNNMRMLHDY